MSKINLTIKGFMTLFVMLASLQLNAQSNVNRCGTTLYHQWKMQTDKNYAKAFAQRDQKLQEWVSQNSVQRTSVVADTIPVVVHVVWNTNAENISDAQIYSQIQVLNDDFGRQNADSVNTPAVWRPIAGALPYYFVLARQDANGAPTTGIVRRQTTTTSFSTNNNVKNFATGGSNAWNTNLYLNIWVCDLGSFLLGYGEFPTGTPSNTFGFVCNYTAFGTIGTAQAPFDLGRTTTHELGHCFNLNHIWGDDGTACTGTDNVADTPNQADENYGCPSFPTISCSNGPNGDMFMNYMDYSDDACMNLFTQGQAARMTTALNAFYPGLINSIGAQYPSSAANDAGVTAVASPSGTLCSGTFIPNVTIKNYGIANLTSATINYSIDNGTVQTQNWTGNLAAQATATVSLASQTVAGGSHVFKSYTSLPNSVTDPNSSNDTTSTSFSVTASVALPYQEPFATVAFPPAGWTINNPDLATTWARNASYGHNANGAMWIDNANYNSNGEIDEAVLPPYNLTSGTNAELTFWVAYTYWTVPYQFSDTLEVLISTDCGLTYTSIYKKWGNTLATAPGQGSDFFPNASQWRLETVSLLPYITATNAIIKFRNITDYENNMFVDDININTLTSVTNKDLNNVINVFPNPTTGKVIVNIGNDNLTIDGVNVFDMMGKKVYADNQKRKESSQLDLSQLSNGVYNVQIISADQSINRSITIKH